MTATWGEEASTKHCHGKITLKLKRCYNFNEVPSTLPARIIDFHNFANILDCGVGISKLAMKRNVLMMKPAIPCYHTGLTLCCVVGSLDLAHVRADFLSA